MVDVYWQDFSAAVARVGAPSAFVFAILILVSSVRVSSVRDKDKNMREKGYHKLLVWQKAHQLVIEIYKITKSFPPEEKYDLISQLRRSMKSVPTNIVEGQASGTIKMFLSYLYKANASLAETEYHLELSRDLKYMTEESYTQLDEKREEVGKMLNSLINSLKNKINN